MQIFLHRQAIHFIAKCRIGETWLFISKFRNFMLFAYQPAKIFIDVVVPGDTCPVSVNMIHIFIMTATMFYKTAVIFIQVFDELIPFHALSKTHFFLEHHFSFRVILFAYILEIHFQGISDVFFDLFNCQSLRKNSR